MIDRKPAIYLRVSTKLQEIDSQLCEITKYVEKKGLSIENCRIYKDYESGKYMNRKSLLELQNDMIVHSLNHPYIHIQMFYSP